MEIDLFWHQCRRPLYASHLRKDVPLWEGVGGGCMGRAAELDSGIDLLCCRKPNEFLAQVLVLHYLGRFCVADPGDIKEVVAAGLFCQRDGDNTDCRGRHPQECDGP